MRELRYTLLADGPADRALMPILTWLLRQHLPGWAIQPPWADLWQLPSMPNKLHQRIIASTDFYQCDLLFIHRDAERASLVDRLDEARKAIEKVAQVKEIPPSIAVVPVRMTEAWLLFDADAIREAADNPNGAARLDLPRLNRIERISDPKNMLHSLIREAAELGTHRRSRFRVRHRVHRVSEYIEDFSPLRELTAFANMENEIKRMIQSQGWGDQADVTGNG